MRLAATQFGAVSRRQARMLGLNDDAINRWMDRGLLVSIHRGVYRIAAVPPSYQQSVWAACSRTRGVASHRCALKMWDLDGYRGDIIELSRTGTNHRGPEGVILHSTDELPVRDLRRHGPIRLTNPTRTLIDAGAVLSEDRLEEALESALRQGLTSIENLRCRLQRMGGPGRRGSGVLRGLLERLDPMQKPTGSTFEVRLLRLLAFHGLPIPVKQFEIFDGDRRVARPDFCYPSLMVAIEAQSIEWHFATAKMWRRDMERLNRLQALGWIVIQIPWHDLVHRPQAVVSQLKDALDRRTGSLCS
jgi:hypothetical protein